MLEWNEKGPFMSQDTLAIAVQTALSRSISHLVVASNTGATADLLLDILSKQDPEQKIQVVVVTHVFGFKAPGENEMSSETRQRLIELGCQVVTAAHALSGAERAMSRKFTGIYPIETIAQTVRMFGAGTKVALEVSLMAMDAGALPCQKPVIAVGGTGRGVDSAVLLTPGYSHSIFDTVIHSILCKPSLLA